MKYDKVKTGGRTYFRYRHWDSVLKKHDVTLYGKTLAELQTKFDQYQAKKSRASRKPQTPLHNTAKTGFTTSIYGIRSPVPLNDMIQLTEIILRTAMLEKSSLRI